MSWERPLDDVCLNQGILGTIFQVRDSTEHYARAAVEGSSYVKLIRAGLRRFGS
jgi:hypothetical protein